MFVKLFVKYHNKVQTLNSTIFVISLYILNSKTGKYYGCKKIVLLYEKLTKKCITAIHFYIAKYVQYVVMQKKI